jgi:hypothetical protein
VTVIQVLSIVCATALAIYGLSALVCLWLAKHFVTDMPGPKEDTL